ncbi:MAG: hypothetical protein EOP48_10650 [Sphingobacteriales bacterium]|nr:MAG: hypothetical protein EOP48_10650 [Sphingobacteriales bacterium]
MKQASTKSVSIAPLYLPVILSYLLVGAPVISYFVAWGGSLFIFYNTWYSPAKYFKEDLEVNQQIMRPIFLIQFIFAGFMAVSSIFYFLDHLGYRYLSKINLGDEFTVKDQTLLIAQCQRLALLAHAALVTGIILMTDRTIKAPQYVVRDSAKNELIWLSLITYLIGTICYRIPGLVQIAIPISTVGIGCAAVLFLRGVTFKNPVFLGVGASIFFLNFVHASLSGFKEPIITNVIILGAVFFPYYKKTIIYLSIPVLYILFYFLPTYNNIIRASWSGEVTAEAAQDQAIETLIGNASEEQIDETNWQFLTNRLSEINMFTQFVDYVPEKRDYYGWEITINSIKALVPRIFWPGKPSIEAVSMERVYEAGVANKLSTVSAKTRPVVDAYLSWGTLGVFGTMIIYGLLVQGICNRAEAIFGGYELGCVIMFNSLFQSLWRGNNFEFMFNNIFYAYLIMWALWYILKTIRILIPNR